MSTTAISSPKNRLPFIKKRPAILLVLLVLAVGAGGALYLIRARQAAATAVPALQVATVRQGSLVISASGSGTLSVSNEIDLAFSTNGQVTAVFVKPGDHVEAGTLLAQIDPQQAQTAFVQARQAYQELTSAAAIATAEQQAAQAQSDLMSARYQLEYLISPEVMYWEAEIAKGQAALTQTKTAAEAAPADQDAQQALKKAKDFLSFAQGKLKEAWNNYDDEYVPKTFRLVEDKLGTYSSS